MTTTAHRSEAEELAELILAKGQGWKSREFLVELRAPEEGATDDGPIPVVLSSEHPVQRWDWWSGEEYIEILDHSKADLSYARDGLPFCLDHWWAKQIGKLDDVRVVEKQLHANTRKGHHPDADWVFKDIRAGIRTKVSLGYLQGEYVVVNPNRKNGELEIRRYAFRALEGSSVCVPADYEVGFGRGLLRALRSTMTHSPSAARLGQETTMSGTATAGAPTAGAEPGKDRETDEALRIRLLDGLDAMGASDAQIRTWIREGTTVKDAKEQLRQAADAAAKAEQDRSKVETGAAPEAFVRSPEGPIGRDGKVKESERTFGFDSPGEFFRSVQRAATRGVTDPRILRAHEMFRAPSGQSGVIDSDGGFAVPPEFNKEIIEPAYETGRILSRVDRLGISGNALVQNMIDETSRAKGSRWGAVTHEWGGETDAPSNTSKVKLRPHRWALNALTLKGFVTDDELEDAPALGTTLVRAFGTEAVFAAEEAIMNGTGNGQPLGIVNSGALVTVAIEGSQTIANTAASIATNLVKMLGRLPSEFEAGAVFTSHRDIRTKVLLATLGGTSAVSGLYIAPGMLSATPRGGILGLEHLVTEYNAAEGTVGDLVLANFKAYRFVERSAAARLQTSAHVRFWESEMAFKLRWRVDGAPLWKQGVTPAKGANTISPFVALAARS